MLLIGMAVGCLLTAGGGCSDFETSGQKEYRDLSYQEYRDRFALRAFDPVGAKRVSVFSNFGRDSYDSWWRIEISREGWVDICKQIGLGQPQPYAPDSSYRFGVPNTWPQALASAPDWWIPSDEFGSELVTSQEQSRDGERATGWYWLYDDKSSTAIGWHWNRQYWKFEIHKQRSGPFERNDGGQGMETRQYQTRPVKTQTED